MKGTRYARATIHRGSGSDEFSLDGFLSDAREEAPLMVGSRPGMQAGAGCAAAGIWRARRRQNAIGRRVLERGARDRVEFSSTA